MQLNIEVIKTEVTTKQGAKSAYKQLEVMYKDLDKGKPDSKKLMDFASKAAFSVLQGVQNGKFKVTSEKNEKTGYWDWTAVEPDTGGTAETSSSGGQTSAKSSAYTAPRSNYETPEERAQKQIYITRSWAGTTALAALSVGRKNAVTAEEIIEEAEKLERWVLNKDAMAKITAMKDDLPDEPEVK